MVLLGLGMGFWMPTFQLAVQNALPHSQLGVGTASVNFFRQIGGTFSIAILGSLLASNFKTNLANGVSPEFSQLLNDPQRLLSPDSLKNLTVVIEKQSPGASEAVIGAAQLALGKSVTDLFLVGVAIVAVGLAIGLFMPRVQMRSREELLAEAQGNEGLATEETNMSSSPLDAEPKDASDPEE
tara:strand:- start:3 stop:551 length:549 start_codon:yes stop_codon:yes gene_type:complete